MAQAVSAGQDFSDDEPIGAAPPRGREAPSQPPGRQQPTRPQPSRRQDAQEAPWEPTIGIDIGVPAPARKLKADPAAQARTMTVVLVAVGAIAAITLVAFLISRLGGDDNGGTSGGLFPGTDARTTTGLPTLATGTGASATRSMAAYGRSVRSRCIRWCCSTSFPAPS
jgi:hypothetical protein